MKTQTLPIKRRPAPKGVFRRLSAVTQGRRKQRVAAAGSVRDMEYDEGGSKISWALTIVFLIHVVALCLIFIHHHFLSGRPVEQTALPGSIAAQVQPVTEAQSAQVVDSQLLPGELPYIAKSGDTYASIAKAKEVLESDLRTLNKHVEIRTGYILKIPVKRVVVKAAPMVQALPTPVVVPKREQGLVKAIDYKNAPKAQPVGAATAGGNAYVVRAGDSIWGIAKRYGVDQNRLMEVNGIADARKLLVGMKLKIP